MDEIKVIKGADGRNKKDKGWTACRPPFIAAATLYRCCYPLSQVLSFIALPGKARHRRR
jgi:hypothetical protein